MKATTELGVSIVAYSSVGRGMVTGRYRSRADFGQGDLRLHLLRFSEENFPKNVPLADKIKAIADKYNTCLDPHRELYSIPGCRTPERVEENVGGAEVELAPKDVQTIRELSEAAEIVDSRYPEAHMFVIEGNCIPLEEKKGEDT